VFQKLKEEFDIEDLVLKLKYKMLKSGQGLKHALESSYLDGLGLLEEGASDGQLTGCLEDKAP
jgi:hypothetical protein